MWTRGLSTWYAAHGRHGLPWRATRDPWAILVSEVMLQQTQVSRVVTYWQAFLDRWPTPAACASASLPEVLRLWQGLGYPRRARALWQAAATIADRGWPDDEASLRALPGLGPYTARALMVLALGCPSPIPIDVNIRRVVARAGLAIEPATARQNALDFTAGAGRPKRMSPRDYTHALFDVGAVHCRASPRCDGCPLARACGFRARDCAPGDQGVRRTRIPAYAGSMRQLRGAVLAALLDDEPPRNWDALRSRVAGAGSASRPGAIAQALESLWSDGLIDSAQRVAFSAELG